MAVQSRSRAVADAAPRAHRGAASSAPRRQGAKPKASTLARHDVIDLIESVARRPSFAGHENDDDVACARCGWRRTTRADAPDAIRRVVMLARQALGGTEQVACLRDQLHVTANRVARFEVDDEPALDPIRIAAPTAASAMLAPGVLISLLDLAATRLIGLVQSCSDYDWDRPGRMGETIVTIGDLVNAVLHNGAHDLADARGEMGLAAER